MCTVLSWREREEKEKIAFIHNIHAPCYKSSLPHGIISFRDTHGDHNSSYALGIPSVQFTTDFSSATFLPHLPRSSSSCVALPVTHLPPSFPPALFLRASSPPWIRVGSCFLLHLAVLPRARLPFLRLSLPWFHSRISSVFLSTFLFFPFCCLLHFHKFACFRFFFLVFHFFFFLILFVVAFLKFTFLLPLPCLYFIISWLALFHILLFL